MNTVSRDHLVNFLYEKVIQRTSINKNDLKLDTELTSVGIKSLDAVLICGQIEDEFSVEVDPMMMFEYRTIDEVADCLIDLFKNQ